MKPFPTLYVASANAHKLEEIHTILGKEFSLVSMQTLGKVPELIENEETFEGNALAKATQLAAWMLREGLVDAPWMTLADDSGLEVDGLDGQPGVKSARFAADETQSIGNAPDEANNAKLLRLLDGVPIERRTGRFRCSLALFQPALGERDSQFWSFEGACEGVLRDQLSGAHGFGYDPLFQPQGYHQTFGELGSEIKDQISHRSRALHQLKDFFVSSYPSLP